MRSVSSALRLSSLRIRLSAIVRVGPAMDDTSVRGQAPWPRSGQISGLRLGKKRPARWPASIRTRPRRSGEDELPQPRELSSLLELNRGGPKFIDGAKFAVCLFFGHLRSES